MLTNSRERYGLLHQLLHWLIALMVIGLLGLGVVMTDFVEDRALQYELYQLHKSFGLTLLALMAVRLGWRLSQPVPPLPAHMGKAERVLARFTHWGFYLLLFAMPIAGLVMISASSLPIGEVFGLFPFPELVGNDQGLYETAREAHEILGWAILGILGMHVAGALKHHFIERDNVLLRMLPGARLRRPAAAEREVS
jgi:cytochrome b561